MVGLLKISFLLSEFVMDAGFFIIIGVASLLGVEILIFFFRRYLFLTLDLRSCGEPDSFRGARDCTAWPYVALGVPGTFRPTIYVT